MMSNTTQLMKYNTIDEQNNTMNVEQCNQCGAMQHNQSGATQPIWSNTT